MEKIVNETKVDEFKTYEGTHVDDFIDGNYGKESYARFVLFHFRLPAVLKIDFNKFMKDYKLFCTYEGKTYAVIGASRMGDVWLTSDLSGNFPYEKRVSIDECSNWSKDV